MEKVAQQATKAAPAVAIAGVLAATPTASHALAAHANPAQVTTQNHAATSADKDVKAGTRHTATLDSVATHTVKVTGAKLAKHAARTTSTTYTVRSGDTLSKIASTHFHNSDWQYLYHVNDKTVANPDLIMPGQHLVIPATAPAHYELTGYVPRHAKSAEAPVSTGYSSSATSSSWSHSGSDSGNGGGSQASAGSGDVVVQSAPQSAGQYSCSSLEQLWEEAGGSASESFMAAEIAMAESGGNPNSLSATADYGLWQINASHGAEATFNPYGNARAAVAISSDGTNWGAWTTYTSGAYAGRC
jgi:LysM repeat protein